MTALALCLVPVLAGMLAAATGTMRTEQFTSVREHDDLIRTLADSSLCDTNIATDSRSQTHIVYIDSGRVFYRYSPSPLPSRQSDEGRQVWSPLVRLSRSDRCASPVIFELAEPGKEPLLVVMWRQMDEGRVRVWRCLHFPRTPPMEWNLSWDVTLPRD